MKVTRLIIILILGIELFSCRPRDEILLENPGITLRFSSDTVAFDTLLTTRGSVTKRMTIYNDNRRAVQITDIDLGLGVSSSYTVYVNGINSQNLDEVTILGNDSILVLVKVFIDPKNTDLPYLVKDSLSFITNGNYQNIKLIAYGQDANFIKDEIITGTKTWSGNRPYVIQNNVEIAPGSSLIIKRGTKIYFDYQSKITVNGMLDVQGTPDSLVIFSNENDLSLNPDPSFGYWKGIIFNPYGSSSSIKGAVIRNAITGITISPGSLIDSVADLSLEEIIIKNMSKNGISAYGADVFSKNCLIETCAENPFLGIGGGNYSFQHCTLYNQAKGFTRQGSTTRFSKDGNYKGSPLSNNLKVCFQNSIIWGSWDEEIDSDGSGLLNAYNSILKTKITLLGVGNIYNQDPIFENIAEHNFNIQAGSPAINNGTTTYGLPNDILSNTRDSSPDIGAYER